MFIDTFKKKFDSFKKTDEFLTLIDEQRKILTLPSADIDLEFEDNDPDEKSNDDSDTELENESAESNDES